MEKLVGEHCPARGKGALVLKLAQIMQFRAKTLGNERVIHRALCNDDVKGEYDVNDPIRKLSDHMR